MIISIKGREITLSASDGSIFVRLDAPEEFKEGFAKLGITVKFKG